MFKNNPITKIELDYLRQIAPHRWWHFLLLLPALVTASFPLFHRFHRGDSRIVLTMAIIILGTYWLLQFRTMYLARKLIQHDFKTELSDEIMGTVSNRQIVMGRLWAILRHQWVWSILISFALLGLSLAVMGWKFRIITDFREVFPHSRGIIEYVGVPYNLIIAPNCNNLCLVYLPHIFHIGLAFIALFTLIKMQTILTLSLSFASNLYRSLALQLIIVMVAILIFSIAYTIRIKPLATNQFSAYHFYQFCPFDENAFHPLSPEQCTELHTYVTQLRIVESAQATMSVFIDSGVTLVTSLLCPAMKQPTNEVTFMSRTFDMDGSMYRHILAAGLAGILQLTLSGVFLRHAIHHANPKKVKED